MFNNFFSLFCTSVVLFFSMQSSAMSRTEIPESYPNKPMYVVKYMDNIQTLEDLLTDDVSVSAPVDEYGNTLLHLAVYTQQVDVISLLLAKGAQVNVANRKSLTPLQALHEHIKPHYFARFHTYENNQDERLASIERLITQVQTLNKTS